MDSRSRVMTAVNHKQPDRVAIDFGSHRSSGISVQAYKALRKYLGLPPSKLFVYDVLQQLAVIEDDVLDLFDVDACQLGYQFYRDPSYWKPWKMHDGTQCMVPAHIDIKIAENGDYYVPGSREPICVQKKDCFYFEQTVFPLEDKTDDDFSDVAHSLGDVMWFSVTAPPSPFSFREEDENYLGKIAKELRKKTTRAIQGIFGGNLVETGQQAFRTDSFYIEMAANPDRVHRFLDAVLEMHMKNLEQYLDAAGDDIDIIGFGDDLGMQTGPQFSTNMFCEFFQPRYQKMWDMVKRKRPELKISMHSCGGIEPFLPYLIEAGLDIVNPVQTTCAGMDPTQLKKKYGSDLVFWGGGCDTREILPNGTPQDVRDNVRKNIEILAPGGGFVFQQVHNILANVPPQNIVAMLEAVKEFRSCGA